MSDFLDMGGYAAFIWPAYLIATVILGVFWRRLSLQCVAVNDWRIRCANSGAADWMRTRHEHTRNTPPAGCIAQTTPSVRCCRGFDDVGNCSGIGSDGAGRQYRFFP